MDEYFKYVKSKNIYLIKKKFLKFNQTDIKKDNQIGGSVNHKLFNKIIKSKDRNEAIKKEEEILIKKISKIISSKKELTKEGFMSYKAYLLVSQLTTLGQIKDDPDFNYDKVIIAGELWAKLYYNFLLKKYKNDITLTKIKSIVTRDTNIT